MPFVNSPNMGLPIPGISTEPGPQFANDINQALSILDSHTHGPGSGVPIGSQSISLQSDLAFNVNNATSLRTVRFISTTATSGTDVGCVYVKGIDLFYNDLNANVVRLTANGGLASTSLTQGIINSTAIISANSPQIPATSGFIRMNNNGDFVSWRNAANTADDKIYFDNADTLQVVGSGGINASPVKFTDVAGNGKVISVQAPLSSSAYSVQWPIQPPSTNAILAMSSAGALLADASNLNLSGKSVKENGNNLVVSNSNALNSLSIVRGGFGSNGTTNVIAGEGFGLIRIADGNTKITFSTPFSDLPVVTATPVTLGGTTITAQLDAFSTSSVQIFVRDSGGSVIASSCYFIAIGQRA